MGHEEIAHAQPVAQLGQQVQDRRLHRDVQRRRRLVEHEKPRAQGDGARDADALLLAAGELVRKATEQLARQPHEVRQLGDVIGQRRALRRGTEAPQRLGDRVEGGEARVEAVGGVLEDHLDQPPLRRVRELRGRDDADVPPREDDAAVRRVEEPGHEPHERGLAAPRLADEADGLAALDRERHIVDGVHAPLAAPHGEALGQRADVEERAHSGLAHATTWPGATTSRGSGGRSQTAAARSHRVR